MRALATIVAALLSISLPQTVAAQDLGRGVTAYLAGDYATALREWRPLAEQGNASAQFNLGSMYDGGQGVPQSYAEAVRWFRPAAEQGHARAQFHLGAMYARGLGVPQNYALAYMWSNLAAAQGEREAANNRDAVARLMSRDQVALAQQMSQQCLAYNYAYNYMVSCEQ